MERVNDLSCKALNKHKQSMVKLYDHVLRMSLEMKTFQDRIKLS